MKLINAYQLLGLLPESFTSLDLLKANYRLQIISGVNENPRLAKAIDLATLTALRSALTKISQGQAWF